MTVIEDLHKSISQMSDAELAETFRQLRLSRRVARKKKTVSTSRVPKKAKLSANKISQTLAAELLKRLGQ